jgi:TonB family protein
MQVCHTDNKVHNKAESDAKPKCDPPYDPKTQFCHTDNKAYVKCDLPYNPETQFCYLNMIYNKCGNIQYAPEMQFCHTDNKVYFRCNEAYNPETHICNYADKKVYEKCGNLQYNPDMQFCHTDKKIYPKCGDKTYKPETQFCYTDKNVYEKCGNLQYNPETHFCHTDNTVKAKGGGTKSSLKTPNSRDIDMGPGGSRSKAEIMEIIKAGIPGLADIHNRYLETKPYFSGNVTLKFTIAPGGNITSISIVSSTTNHPEFDNAVKNMVATWKWKAINNGDTTPTIHFDFRTE